MPDLRSESSWKKMTNYYVRCKCCDEYKICKTTVDGVSRYLPWHNQVMLSAIAFDTAQEARECAAKHAEGGHVRI